MPNDIWSALPADVRSEVDALVRQDRRLNAVMAIRESFAADKPGLYEALDVVVERYRVLGQSLFTPSKLLDPDELLARVETLSVRPDAIEAVWDGDTDGWFVRLFAVTADPHREFPLGLSRRGTDLRLFNGEVPPWPEAVEVAAVGGQLAERLGVPFHFASPDRPDDAAPRWWDTR